MATIAAQFGFTSLVSLSEAVPVVGQFVKAVEKIGKAALKAHLDKKAVKKQQAMLQDILASCEEIGQRLDQFTPPMRDKLEKIMAQLLQEDVLTVERWLLKKIDAQQTFKELQDLKTNLHTQATLLTCLCLNDHMLAQNKALELASMPDWMKGVLPRGRRMFKEFANSAGFIDKSAWMDFQEAVREDNQDNECEDNNVRADNECEDNNVREDNECEDNNVREDNDVEGGDWDGDWQWTNKCEELGCNPEKGMDFNSFMMSFSSGVQEEDLENFDECYYSLFD